MSPTPRTSRSSVRWRTASTSSPRRTTASRRMILHEAAEILALMVKEKQKKTYVQSAQIKKDKELSRGYANRPFRERPFKPGLYKLSIRRSVYGLGPMGEPNRSYVSDKRTAIDIAVGQTDVAETGGTLRWIDTRAMISDPLTKQHPSTYLRYVLEQGMWSIMEEGGS